MFAPVLQLAALAWLVHIIEAGETERLAAEEAAKIASEQAEVARIEAERIETDRLESERIMADRSEAERLEAQRIAAERAEVARIEAERRVAEVAAAAKAREQAWRSPASMPFQSEAEVTRTGAFLGFIDASPTSPGEFPPQQYRFPPRRIAHVCSAPPVTTFQPSAAVICVGTSRTSVVPSPSWPA